MLTPVVADNRKGEVLRRVNAARPARKTSTGIHPARTVVGSFLVLMALGTVLLLLPGMTSGPSSLGAAMFTAVSAVSVTGLSVVDMAYFTGLGKVVILLLVQVGGFGIMTLGTLAVLLVSKRLGLQARLATRTETNTAELGDLAGIVRGVGKITLTVEASIALLLTARMWLGYDHSFGYSLWWGVFHSVTSFNNAGFALESSSLTAYAGDALILLPIAAAMIIGGLGFPVLLEFMRRLSVRRRGAPRRLRARALPLTLHTRLMLLGTGVIMLTGAFGFALFEWTNPATIGAQPWPEKLLQTFFNGSVNPRSGGFNTLSWAEVRPETRLVTNLLMFTGGGSASTAGGVKITTMVILVLAVLAEVRARQDVTVLDRQISFVTVRIALAVVTISAFTVLAFTLALEAVTQLGLDVALFEVISAIGNVGLSADATPLLPERAQVLLMFLMLLGRVGPVTLASAMLLSSTKPRYRLPEGRPLIG